MENKPLQSLPQTIGSNIAETALAAGTALAKPITNPHAHGDHAVMVPDGFKLEYLKRPEMPPRSTGVVKLFDAESFISYWGEEHKEAVSRIYASMEPAQFVAVLNDHAPDKPNWKDYRAVYAPKHSREWLTWSGSNRKEFAGNDAFAIWLEDNAIDIATPDPAHMMSVALNMRVSQAQGFSKAVRLNDGNVQFTYSNVVSAEAQAQTGSVAIPETFTIRVPVFEGLNAPRYDVEARFRYQLNSGALKIRYELVRPHKVVELAFQDMVNKIEKESKATILFGLPE